MESGVFEGRITLTPKELSQASGIPEKTLADWRLKRKEIPFITISRRKVLYPVSGIKEWIKKNACLTLDLEWNPEDS